MASSRVMTGKLGMSLASMTTCHNLFTHLSPFPIYDPRSHFRYLCSSNRNFLSYWRTQLMILHVSELSMLILVMKMLLKSLPWYYRMPLTMVFCNWFFSKLPELTAESTMMSISLSRVLVSIRLKQCSSSYPDDHGRGRLFLVSKANYTSGVT